MRSFECFTHDRVLFLFNFRNEFKEILIYYQNRLLKKKFSSNKNLNFSSHRNISTVGISLPLRWSLSNSKPETRIGSERRTDSRSLSFYLRWAITYIILYRPVAPCSCGMPYFTSTQWPTLTAQRDWRFRVKSAKRVVVIFFWFFWPPDHQIWWCPAAELI